MSKTLDEQIAELIALAPQMAARILDDASVIDGLNGVIDSQKQTHDVLVKKLRIATEALREAHKCCILADGWEDCETFYEDMICAIKSDVEEALTALTKENENV